MRVFILRLLATPFLLPGAFLFAIGLSLRYGLTNATILLEEQNKSVRRTRIERDIE